MINVQTLTQAITESSQIQPGTRVNREHHLDWLKETQDSQLIKAVVGFRRAGKSYLLKLYTDHLLKTGRPPSNILYLNLENDLLKEIRQVTELRQIWDLYLKEIAVLTQPITIILDEVQLVSGWENFIRTLHEQGKYNLIVSGSNSQLLSGEFSSTLSGRALTREVRPFNFKEFLEYNHVEPTKHRTNPQINQLLMTYLRRGGIAEQFNLSDEVSKTYAEGLIQKIILDDIVKRFQIDKVTILKQAFDFVCGNVTSTLSLRNIINRLDYQGLTITSVTLDNYIEYWKTAYALEPIYKFDYRLSKVFDRTAKYYLVDNIFISGRQDSDEKRLENLVFNELVQRFGRNNINYGQDENGYEVDFVVRVDDKALCFQVCHTLTNDNQKRELGNLELVDKYLSAEGIVLYLNDNRTDQSGNVKWIGDWLLE